MANQIQKTTLRQRLRPIFAGMDVPLLLAFALLASLGMLIMYSSGYDHGERFNQHGRNLLLAVGIMFFVAQLSLPTIMRFALPVYLVGLLLLVAVALFGISRKGSTRWLNLGVIIQPSEIMKIGVPLMLAWWFQMREGQLRLLDFCVAFILLLLPVGLIFKQPDLGTALLVLSGGLFVIYFAGLRWRWILPIFIIGAIGIGLIVFFGDPLCADGVNWKVLREYQRQRVCTLLDPTRDPLGRGFHIIQGMIAIGSGGFWGKGFMNGTQTHLEFIPERTTDFIFAAYSEEFGLMGNLLLIGTFLFLVYRGLVIASQAPTQFSRLLAGAIAMIFFIYAFVNMGMVSGILPVVGVPLPFISYGGTAMTTLGLGLGILLAISKARKIIQS